MVLVKRGHRGRKVVDIQTKLSRLGFDLGRTGIDGIFGPETEKAVRAFQQKRNLEVDGIVGPETWRELVEASYQLGDRQLYLREPPFRGDDVREVQATLNNLGFNAGRVTGVFGSQTDKAVREFQRNAGLPVDGIVGETTIKAMDNLKKRIKSGSITGIWERGKTENLHQELQDRRLAIDFNKDPLARDIGLRLGNLLEKEGAKVFYSYHLSQTTSVAERAEVANQKEVDILISFDFNYSDKEKERGSQCYYFATGEYFSARSKRLAELIQNELTSNLKLFDRGVEGKNLTILRGTKMPAVLIKPVFTTNPDDKKILSSSQMRQKIARAVLVAIKRFWQE